MRRISISDKDMFDPEEGEIFFAEVSCERVDRKIKALVSKYHNPCHNCCFCLEVNWWGLCLNIRCLKDDGTQLTFRRESDGKI